MKQSIASAPAEIWNQKNLPSDIERFEESPRQTTKLIGQLVADAAELARRLRGVLILSLAALGVLGLVWYLSKGD